MATMSMLQVRWTIFAATFCLIFSTALSLSIGRTVEVAIETESGAGGAAEQQLLTPPGGAADVDKLRTSTYYSCDHLVELNQNRTEKFEVCCAGFQLGTWDCTKESQVGHACTAVQAPACCKCAHLPPDPVEPTSTSKPDADDDDDEGNDDDTKEDDATDEEEEDEEEE